MSKKDSKNEIKLTKKFEVECKKYEAGALTNKAEITRTEI